MTEANPAGQEQGEGKKSYKTLGIGCLVFLGIFIIVGIYIFYNVRTWAAQGMRRSFEIAVSQADLPDAKAESINKDLNKLLSDFENERISFPQLSKIAGRLARPMTALYVRGLENKHIKPSSLTKEEKAQASVTLDRFVVGLIDGKISPKRLNQIFEETQLQGKEEFTADELRKLLGVMKEEVKEAGVTQEPRKVDFAGEVHQAIYPSDTQPATQKAPTTQPV